MYKIIEKNLSLLLFSFGLFAIPSSSFAKLERPKLLLVLVIDQFRADYLTRFESQFLPKVQKSGELGGFAYLKEASAYFPLAQYNTLQNITAPGHATILTGAYPYLNGIPLNDWFDEKTSQTVYCVEDPQSSIIGSTGPLEKKTNLGPESRPMNLGMSPKNLNATTIGDELKNAGYPSRVVSIALKDRSSILLGGHRADLALWFDSTQKEWISSQHYLPEGKLPEWVLQLNRELKSTPHPSYEWKLLSNGTGPTDEMFSKITPDKLVFPKGSLESLASPYGLELTLQAAEKALEVYQLGSGNSTDVLAISFSSHDFVGHAYGPNSRQMEEMTLAEDRVISHLLNTIRKKIPGGLKNAVIVFTADHGAPSSPEWAKNHKMNAGRINPKTLAQDISIYLDEKYGKPQTGEWILMANGVMNFYLNHAAIQQKKLDLATIQSEAKAILLKNKDIAYVMTSSDYDARKFLPGAFEIPSMHHYVRNRSGDLIVIPRPYYISGSSSSTPGSTSHLTGYNYDRTVPIIISGFNIKPGTYPVRAEVVDIAPTLAFLLGTIPPSLAEGRILSEIIENNRDRIRAASQ